MSTTRRELKLRSSNFESGVSGQDFYISNIELQPLILSGRLSPIIVEHQFGDHSVDQSHYNDDGSDTVPLRMHLTTLQGWLSR